MYFYHELCYRKFIHSLICSLTLPLSGYIQQTIKWQYFSYFSQKTGFDISYKLETICIKKSQILFSGKNIRIRYFKISSAENFIQSV